MMPLVRRHLAIGWWCLLLFLCLGVLLEGLHGLKVRWYLDVTNQTRRLMPTLAHAHGALLSLVHVAFAATLYVHQRAEDARQHAASRALTALGLAGER